MVAHSMAVAAIVWTHRHITRIAHVRSVTRAHAINAHPIARTVDMDYETRQRVLP
ncbi:hypothetical protein L798_01087 [Zootermopsis nevadensis]|uniref:Uncharacterized protein n=1 Tax=Zootermopsis nevadensis TaxID=136037 RepID=A0A067RH53_ZOONE|nr:hypothetical protein L798_01087 [Zootermopsis nevadensis]